jgi:hypothetical protein
MKGVLVKSGSWDDIPTAGLDIVFLPAQPAALASNNKR